MAETTRTCCGHASSANLDCQPSSSGTVLTQAPILSTPENYGYDSYKIARPRDKTPLLKEQIWRTYEVERTAREILNSGRKRVALQFPDGMLGDAGVVVDGIRIALRESRTQCAAAASEAATVSRDMATTEQLPGMESGVVNGVVKHLDSHLTPLRMNGLVLSDSDEGEGGEGGNGLKIDIVPPSRPATTPSPLITSENGEEIRLYILADTAYGSCCVDEVAAQHVDADVIVHYGRSCLSPTTRLPVIYVFTAPPLDLDAVAQSFAATFPVEERVVLMADIPYHSHVQAVADRLAERGYANVIVPQVVHDPASRIPNRTVAPEIDLREYSLFHISEPPPALLLTLSSRVKDMFIFPTTTTITASSAASPNVVQATTSHLIRRRYALLNSLNTCPIFGILINTLSVANHLDALKVIQKMIRDAGKKYYTFVVGKVNAAKMANFSEVGGWVVVGCWESSLLESEDFYRPVITPWELDWVLQSDKIRVWKGEWRGDFGGIGERNTIDECESASLDKEEERAPEKSDETAPPDSSSESESEPPEFDLRTGRYVSYSRPMQMTTKPDHPSASRGKGSTALSRKTRGDHLATVNGTCSPGAEFLRTQRTWTGLGSDFSEDGAGAARVEIGRGSLADEAERDAVHLGRLDASAVLLGDAAQGVDRRDEGGDEEEIDDADEVRVGGGTVVGDERGDGPGRREYGDDEEAEDVVRRQHVTVGIHIDKVPEHAHDGNLQRSVSRASGRRGASTRGTHEGDYLQQTPEDEDHAEQHRGAASGHVCW
ncbi:2-(3-amino-3-carboxypropyl)histidine synthase subunit 2 [Podosphaera aphanis]|nr:2-(3-amino-3-carboxypropyl)histidine synthase subunit 2 [Podosphaera aphanis]